MLPAKKYRPPLVPSQNKLQPLKVSKVNIRETKYLPKNIENQKYENKTLRNNSRRPTSASNNGSYTSLRAVSANRLQSSSKSIRSTRNSSKQSIKTQKQELFLFPPPKITSKNWGIYQLNEKKKIAGFKTERRREMASLTKIMNFVTILAIIKQKKINPSEIRIPVEERASKINGTTANLQKGMVLSIKDLFYGMMLPSGNDAAYQLAIIGGAILKFFEINPYKDSITSEQIRNYIVNEKQLVFRYLKEMNKKSKTLNMIKSKWSNPHGLSNRQNFTTVDDLFLLCAHAMKIRQFREVVETKYYSCVVQKIHDENIEQNTQMQNMILSWENTNKMLWKGWSGIKTGITPNAGPCLAASVTKNQKQYLVILGDCLSMDKRWQEVQQLVEWAMNQDLTKINNS